MAKTPTWQRKAGQSESGGLNEKGRASLRAAGHDIKRPQPEGGARKRSFCARMEGMKRENTSAETARDPDSRINKSLRKWKCADGGAVDPYDSVQQAAKGGPIWDRPRPKKLGKSEPLSPKQKASAKAAAKAAGRPYPNLIDNMRAARADGGQIEGDVQFAEDDPYAKVQEAARLPMMAQNEYSMRMPQSDVRYDTGPQPGEATMKAYEPTIKERIYQTVAGTEERPSPERAQFARGISNMAEFAPVLGNVMAGQEAQRRGDSKGMLMAALPVPGMATEARMAQAAITPAEQAAKEAYQRVLNAQGLYSHAAEAAANLPQAKGSYEQMMAMLQRAGVKPEELHWSGAQQFAGQPVTREQLVQHFEQGVPKIDETVLGGKRPTFWNVSSAGIPGGGGGQQRFATRELAEQELARRQQEYPDAFHSISDLPTMESRPKFEQYALPGGENYREVLMHTPVQTSAKAKEAMELTRRMNEGEFNSLNDQQRKELFAKRDQLLREAREDEGTPYKSSHWDQPNVLAHLRLSDRTGPEGEKILHMEELQSDWGQEGRRKGFAQKLTPELQEQVNNIASKLDPRFVPPHARNSSGTGIDTENFLIRDINHWKETGAITPEDARVLTQYANIKSGLDLPPAAPYVASPEGKHTSSWVDLGLKRALREAAEGGYNKLVWTPGAEQASRYSLSRQVDSIAVPSVSEAGRSVRIDSKDGNSFRMMVNNEGVVDGHGSASQFTGKKLDEVVGKEMADKIMGINQPHEFSGEGLNVGGEGMKSFYDKIVPTQLQKILKKLDPDAKVQMGGHAVSVGKGKPTNYRDFEEWSNAPESRQINAHVIEITPRMREAILKGLPAFADGGKVVNKSDPYDNIQEAAKIHPRARRASH